jgi:hypothetical protein
MIPAGQLVPGGPGVVDGRIRFSPDTPRCRWPQWGAGESLDGPTVRWITSLVDCLRCSFPVAQVF